MHSGEARQCCEPSSGLHLDRWAVAAPPCLAHHGGVSPVIFRRREGRKRLPTLTALGPPCNGGLLPDHIWIQERNHSIFLHVT